MTSGQGGTLALRIIRQATFDSRRGHKSGVPPSKRNGALAEIESEQLIPTAFQIE
jgi:hypothetical protein